MLSFVNPWQNAAFPPALLAALALGGCDGTPRDRVPSFMGATVDAQTYFRDASIPDLALPEALGGDGARRYSLDPPPPPGLTFDAATRTLSGTPTETLETTRFTYLVRDADGDTDALTFTLSVVALSLDADPEEVGEWNHPGATLTVGLSGPAPDAVEVTLALGGTAVPGGDYEITDFRPVDDGEGDAGSGGGSGDSGSGDGSDSGSGDSGSGGDSGGGGDDGDDPGSTGPETPGSVTVHSENGGTVVRMVIGAGAGSALATLLSIPDFEEEGTKTIEISATSANGSRFAGSGPAASLELLDEGAMFADAKDRTTSATLALFNNFRQTATGYEFHFVVINFGAATASPSTLTTRIGYEGFTLGRLPGGPLVSRRFGVPELPPGAGVRGQIGLPNWLRARWGPGVYAATAVLNAPQGDYFSRTGGVVDRHSVLIPEAGANPFTCQEAARPVSPGAEDPLRPQQWNLHNTGQTAFAADGGLPGEDLGMTATLANGPTGNGVEIAVVDTGLEICHPDLRDNVAPGASHNFNAAAWPGSVPADPFNPSADSDHGTSVAGLIAATADNGIGVRGVAPGARLRGYNYLSAFERGSDPTIHLDSLGASMSEPDSTGAHVFNMSYGFLHGLQGNSSRPFVATLAHGVTDLRNGLGALYVKAAGNGFRYCFGLRRQHRFADRDDPYRPNDALGCSSANGDYNNNLPQIIVAGAFNARGERASYSAAGANLWVTAPGGELGSLRPAMVTTDQAGTRRGVDNIPGATDPEGVAPDPHGDYRRAFAGTSAAAPNTSGAIALLLEARPALTWRDIKHILARTARKIDPDVEPVRIAFGGTPTTLRHGWITNAAGYNFHNWYGFGAVNVDAAVELARSITPDGLGDPARVAFAHEGPVAIPDNDGGGASQTLAVSGVGETANIEAVELILRATHDFPNDLGVTLISPAGTESIVNPVYNDALTADPGGFRDWSLLTNAFYGESPNGDWTLRVIDAAPGDTGSLDGWTLNFWLGEHPE